MDEPAATARPHAPRPETLPRWPWVAFPAGAIAAAALLSALVVAPWERGRMEAEAAARLTDVARDRARALDGRLGDLVGMVEAVASFPSVRALVVPPADPSALPYPSDAGAAAHVREVLDEIQGKLGFGWMTVAGRTGEEVLPGAALPRAPAVEALHARAVAARQTRVDVVSHGGRRLLVFAAPVWGGRGAVEAAVLAGVEVERGIEPLLRRRPHGWATATVALVSAAGAPPAVLWSPGDTHGTAAAAPEASIAATAELERARWRVRAAVARRELDARARAETVTYGGGLAAAGALLSLLAVYAWQRRQLAHLVERERSDRRLSEVLQHAQDVMLVLESDGRVADVRGASRALYGYGPEELVGRSLQVLAPPSTPEGELRDTIASILAEGGRVFEVEARRRDGSRFIAEVAARRIEGADPPRVLAISRDVTARKAGEAALARLATAVEQTSEALLITDEQGRIEYANPAFEQLTGWSRAELAGLTPRILKSGAQPSAFYTELWRRLARGESVQTRLRNRRKDGSTYLAELLVTPVRERGEHIVGYVGLQRDVTREHEIEMQLRQAQRIEAIGQLTGGIAHDFNNILAIVLSNVALLEEELPDEGESRHALEDLRAAGQRGAELVRKLLTFGRREPLTMRSVALGEMVEDAARTLGRLLPENIRIVTAIEPAGRVMADPGSIDQIVINLATNARDAMPEGGVLRLAVRETRGAAGADQAPVAAGRRVVELRVEDTGVGMDAATLERVFEPFFTTKPQGKGTGLGLAMVYGLVRQHGGQVHVESTPGRGTTVVVELPALEGVARSTAPVAAPQALVGGHETLLFVEDDATLRRVAVRTLERLGYTVLTAADGAEALALLEEDATPVDAVVTDVVMPRLGGVELLETLRRRARHVPVVLVSGYGTEELPASALELDGVRALQKPWTVVELTQTIRQALDAR